jgi:precorrin-6B methylase 2
MVYRLNNVLAYLYPSALAAEALVKPRKRPSVDLFDRPINFRVLSALADLTLTKRPDGWSVWFMADKTITRELTALLELLGATPCGAGSHIFDYDPKHVFATILATGMVPDEKAHQYYPTPPEIADRVIELAGILDGDEVLEPSAGTGGLTKRITDRARVWAVEVAPLHCEVLRAHCHEVTCADFLECNATVIGGPFDRIVMNPPFCSGQWRAHVDHAADMLAPGGRLVAVLPASAIGSLSHPDFTVRFKDRYDNAFAGCSVSVVIAVVERVE